MIPIRINGSKFIEYIDAIAGKYERCSTYEAETSYHYVGTANEIKNKSRKAIYKLSKGTWSYVDYYDHNWTMVAYKDRTEDFTFNLDRVTDSDSNYGFISLVNMKDMRKQLDEEDKEEGTSWEEDMDFGDIIRHDDRAVVTFGRGETEHIIYTATDEDNLITAFIITNDSFLEMMLESSNDKTFTGYINYSFQLKPFT